MSSGSEKRRRSTQINVRFTPEEMAQVRELARQGGQSAQDYLRERVTPRHLDPAPFASIGVAGVHHSRETTMTDNRKPDDVLHILDSLPTLLRSTRVLRRQSLRQVAAETGLSFSTVTRVERGEDCTLSNARALLVWIMGAALTPKEDQ